MSHTSMLKTASIITAALVIGGCQFISPRSSRNASPTPSARTTPRPTTEATATASPSATPIATGSAQVTTKGGTVIVVSTPKPAVKGATTTTTTVTKTNPLYDTNMDLIDFTVYPGQSQETTVILYNKSNAKVMFAAFAPEKQSDSYPVKVNGSNETTGTIDAQGNSSFTVSTISSGNNPGFSTSVTVNFVSMDNKVLATRKIAVSTHTATGDVTTLETHTDTEKTGNATMSVAYKQGVAYPFKLVNKHGQTFTWKAVINGIDPKAVVLSANQGTFNSNDPWFSTFRFTPVGIGSVRQFTIEVTFESLDKLVKEVKTITVNIQ